MSQNIFEQIASAQTSQGGDRMKEGRYLLAVERLFLDISKKDKSTLFKAEFRVMECSPCGEKDDAGNPIDPNTVASKVPFIRNMSVDTYGLNKAAVKALFLGLFGEELSAEDVATMCSDKQPARGMLVRCETYRGNPIKSGANAGKPYIGHSWTTVNQTPEEIAKVRAQLGY